MLNAKDTPDINTQDNATLITRLENEARERIAKEKQLNITIQHELEEIQKRENNITTVHADTSSPASKTKPAQAFNQASQPVEYKQPSVQIIKGSFYNFKIAILALAQGQLNTEWEAPLRQDLLKNELNNQDVSHIKSILQGLDSPEKYARLKEKIITLVTADEESRMAMSLNRGQEKTGYSNYASYILGMGRNTFEFKPTKSLTRLDEALGLIEPWSLKKGFARMALWATANTDNTSTSVNENQKNNIRN